MCFLRFFVELEKFHWIKRQTFPSPTFPKENWNHDDIFVFLLLLHNFFAQRVDECFKFSNSCAIRF